MSRRPLHASARQLTAAAIVAFALCVVTGCAPQDTPAPTISTPAPNATADSGATPPPSPSEPVLTPEGSAADNEPVFTAALQQAWNGADRQSADAYIAALEAAGFAAADLQITPDRTSVGEVPDSIQVSARWAGECLVGHLAFARSEPVVEIMPMLSGETCLLGSTRPIG